MHEVIRTASYGGSLEATLLVVGSIAVVFGGFQLYLAYRRMMRKEDRE